jgi:flagellar basal body-associated protein FliL
MGKTVVIIIILVVVILVAVGLGVGIWYATKKKVPDDGKKGTTSPKKGKFIKITHEAVGILNVAEIEAFGADGTTKITPAAASASSTLDNNTAVFGAANLIDNNFDKYAHTMVNVANQWLQIAFDGDKEITKIKITNRKDCCKDRIIGSKVLLIDSNNTTVWSADITDAKDFYEFTVV